MKLVTALLCLSAAGYAADHWDQLTGHHEAEARPRHHLLIYGTKDSAAYVQLEYELKKQDIPFEDRNLADKSNVTELIDKRARIGRAGNYRGPVAEIDGVLLEGARIQDVTRRMR